MKFSVITPCYNSGQFLKETMLSVLLQKGDFSIEYIVVDGQSTDSSPAIVLDLKEQLTRGLIKPACNGISLEFISEPDKGMYDAISKGLQRASGDIVSYLNADDIYFPGALNYVSEVMKKHQEVQWLSSKHVKIDSRGTKFLSFLPFDYNRTHVKAGLHGSLLPFIQQENVFWRSQLSREINLDVFRSFKLAGDFYLWFCFAKRHELYIVDKELAAFRTHEVQLSQIQREKYQSEFDSIRIPSAFSKWQIFLAQFKQYKYPDWLKRLTGPHILTKL